MENISEFDVAMGNFDIDIFMPVPTDGIEIEKLAMLAANDRVKNLYVWCVDENNLNHIDAKIKTIKVTSLSDTALFVNMARTATANYVICVLKENIVLPSAQAIVGMCEAMDEASSLLYCDYRKYINGELCDAPTIDYAVGSLRNDFDFGAVVALRTSCLKQFAAGDMLYYKYAGFYQLRLFLSRVGHLQHLCRTLYSEQELDLRRSGEKQFDYVNPAQRQVQKEMEKVCTEHLQAIGAWLPPFKYTKIDLSIGDFPVEASVVIPVLNRVSTIADAIRSVLEQKTNFQFNILVVDNHSTDGTSRVIDSFDDKRVCHLVPERTDLGIGGCWNYAINSEACGRFAVQLDSDDIYSGPDTLQRIVDEFYKQQCAMLVGSYKICDFNLNTLPPGVIDHREWSEENGRNNALRINGLGAPRAFFTPIVRRVGFPNVSYGEDYAVGLAISRNCKIGRIYDVLYLCRRWDGNSDSSLSHEKVNAHNRYKDSLRSAELLARIEMLGGVNIPSQACVEDFFHKQIAGWQQANERYRALSQAKERLLGNGITLQYNPARMVSTAANVGEKAVKERKCFLCADNRPQEQNTGTALFDMEILVNPFPILPLHLTLPLNSHTPQRISHLYYDMLSLAKQWPAMALFYNGPKCGASAPDHAHLQAVRVDDIPILGTKLHELVHSHTEQLYCCGSASICRSLSYFVPLFILKADTPENMLPLFDILYNAMQADENEPLMNVLSYNSGENIVTMVFPRSRHRPSCYYMQGDAQRLVSPGLLDMAGLLITPRKEDFERIIAEEAARMLGEVAIDESAACDISRRIKTMMYAYEA